MEDLFPPEPNIHPVAWELFRTTGIDGHQMRAVNAALKAQEQRFAQALNLPDPNFSDFFQAVNAVLDLPEGLRVVRYIRALEDQITTLREELALFGQTRTECESCHGVTGHYPECPHGIAASAGRS